MRGSMFVFIYLSLTKNNIAIYCVSLIFQTITLTIMYVIFDG